MRGNIILETAIQNFKTITGTNLTLLDREQGKNTGNQIQDAVLELKQGDQKALFLVEIKNEIREQNLPAIFDRRGGNAGKWLLVCQYIPKPLKEKLKDMGVNYLEAAGNCFIRKDGLFFYVNDKAVTVHRKPAEGKLWNQAGLKFLFGILIKPRLLNTTYRQIALETKVALGNIGPFIEELKQEGYLKEGVENGHSMLFLENKEQLQHKWIELFYAVLKPKLKQGKFRFLNKTDAQNWQLVTTGIPANFFWGGEPAGAILTGFLQPEKFTIYTKENKTTIMKHLELVPDKDGNVELMNIFWATQEPGDLNTSTKIVPPLLAYAELITSLDSRNRETAALIKQKHLD